MSIYYTINTLTMLIYIHLLYTFIYKIIAEIRIYFDYCSIQNFCIKWPGMGQNISPQGTTNLPTGVGRSKHSGEYVLEQKPTPKGFGRYLCTTCSIRKRKGKYIHKALPDMGEDGLFSFC